jgi:hypothetical protein
MNAALPSLAKDGQEMTERKLVRKVVIRNIPESWKRDFALKGGEKLKTLKYAKRALMTIERAYDFEPRTRRKKTRNKASDNGNENGDKTDTSSLGKNNAAYRDMIMCGRTVPTIHTQAILQELTSQLFVIGNAQQHMRLI